MKKLKTKYSYAWFTIFKHKIVMRNFVHFLNDDSNM